MRFVFKTDYNQDIHLAKHGGHVFWYGLLLVLLVLSPVLLDEYWLAQLTFVLIYSIVGLGLMLLAGFTGLFSMGHAAFLGVGAYTQAVCTQAGLSFVPALVCATGLSAAVGVVVGLPALRIKGIYLGIATLSFGFIVEEVLENRIGFYPTYGNTLMGLAASVPLTPEDQYSITYYAPQPRAILRVVDPEHTQNTVEYDTWGRVELTTLTREFFMPRFLERDEAIRRPPCSEFPWDGVGDVRPFQSLTKTIIEGVY